MALKGRGVGSVGIVEGFGVRSPAVPVFGVAGWLGVGLRWASEPGWEGAVSASGGRAEIWVRAEAPLVRQRFAVAHELGHLMLHRSSEVHFRDVSPATTMRPSEERDANAFAAALLMPRFLFQPLVYGSGLSIDELAAMFEVSSAAVEFRVDWVREGRVDP